MKKIYAFVAALFAFFATAAVAETVIVQGCEIKRVEGANYSNKVDSTCVFASEQGGGGDNGFGAIVLAIIEAQEEDE